MSEIVPFDEYVGTLDRITVPADELDDDARQPFVFAANALRSLEDVDRATVSALVQRYPEIVPMLGSVCGLSQESLKNTLRHGLGTAGWIKVGRERPDEVVALLDDELGLVERVAAERFREWSYADVLLERSGSRRSAGRAIGRGRSLEDEVEAVVVDLGLPYQLRGRFVGRRGATAPSDLAIPSMADAGIVCAMKGFDSTGSKLTAAVTELEEVASVRTPRQFVFAIVDGIGWKGRMNDLRRIHALWERGDISGLYSRQRLPQFREDVADAARILHYI